MKYTYGAFVKPVLKGLGADACAELSHDAVAQGFLKKMGRPFGGFARKTRREVMLNYIYKCATDFYIRTNFFDKKCTDDTQNFKLIVKRGKEKLVRDAFKNVASVPSESIEVRLENFKIIAEHAVLKKISRRAR